MRRTLSLCRSGLAAAAAVVLLTACGGSGDDNTAAETSATSTSSASETPENTAPQADSEFCTEAAAIQERVSASFTSADDQANLSQIFQQAADEVRAIEPPDELAADWASFADGIEQFAQISQIDFNDPNAYAQWQAQAQQIQTDYGPAFASVQNYLASECGLTDGEATDPAAPTS
jgi:hypothetical protein